MAALFATTLFLSATLLFWVQPMLAKMVLPLLGGTPAVWNTCMVFFQALLLLGYAYAHWLGNRFSLRRQLVVHGALLLVTALTLPIKLPHWLLEVLPWNVNPAGWLLGSLLVCAGLPFFAVSTNAPLLQRWYSLSGAPSAQDPYFLYAASNVGSLAALLAYPLWVERAWRLQEQSHGWSVLYWLLTTLILVCGVRLLWRRRSTLQSVSETPAGLTLDHPDGEVVRGREGWRWCLLAFVPSSLMLGVTTYLTTDIASFPLLWVLPLSLYLLSFVLAFSRWRWGWVHRLVPIGAIALLFMVLSEATQPTWLLLGLHLIVFFVTALACHARLAVERPAPRHLTRFYLWISFGGVLGGTFNALVAPMLFRGLIEYPLAMVAACCLLPTLTPSGRQPRWTGGPLAAVCALLLVTLALGYFFGSSAALSPAVRSALVWGLPLVACYVLVDRPRDFALGLMAMLAASLVLPGTHGRPLRVERNFFGVLKVTRDPLGKFYRLVHGNTIHGRAWIDPVRRDEPLSYYHRSGPLGQIFATFNRHPASLAVGVIGLGAGSMASYARPGERWTFYEINPAVEAIARDTNYFSFLQHSPAEKLHVLLGDARLRLREAPPQHYGLLVIDAFSSDAIPVHLITREALRLYLEKLAPGGLLVFHISNRNLELEGVLGDLAKDAQLVCHAHDEVEPSAQESAAGKDQSHWMVMCRERVDLGPLARDSRWLPIQGSPQPVVWSDDYSNLISVFKWN